MLLNYGNIDEQKRNNEKNNKLKVLEALQCYLKQTKINLENSWFSYYENRIEAEEFNENRSCNSTKV